MITGIYPENQDEAKGYKKWSKHFPLMTTLIILICFLIHLAFAILDKKEEYKFHFMISSNNIFHRLQFYRLITAGFLHADMSHLAFNMFAVLFLAPRIEKTFGSLFFLYSSFTILIFAHLLLATIYAVFDYLPHDLLTNIYGAKVLPSYINTLGYSGVIFGYLVINFFRRENIMFDICGCQIKGRLIPPLYLLINTLLFPGASFTGHLCGGLLGQLFNWGIFTTCVCCLSSSMFECLDRFLCPFRYCPRRMKYLGIISTQNENLNEMQNKYLMKFKGICTWSGHRAAAEPEFRDNMDII